MKKVLVLLGVLFVVAVALVVVFFVTLHRTGGGMQETFFAAVATGDPKQLTAMFHSSLVRQVDEPVLAEFMKLVNDRRGRFRGLRKMNWNTAMRTEAGVKIVESRGTVEFEKGPATSELVFHNGKLIKFFLSWENFPKDWFTGPADTALYRRRGEAFLKAFLERRGDDAFAMMHPALQKSMPAPKLKAMIAGVTAKAGGVKGIEHDAEEVSKGRPVHLKVRYKVVCEKASTTAEVDFQFVGLKGHLVAFDLNPGGS